MIKNKNKKHQITTLIYNLLLPKCSLTTLIYNLLLPSVVWIFKGIFRIFFFFRFNWYHAV